MCIWEALGWQAQSHWAEHPSHSSCCCLTQSKPWWLMRNLVYEMPGEQCLTLENGGWFWILPLTRGNACSHCPHPCYESWVYISLASCRRKSQVDNCSHWSKGCGLLSLHACLYSVFCACLCSVYVCFLCSCVVCAEPWSVCLAQQQQWVWAVLLRYSVFLYGSAAPRWTFQSYAGSHGPFVLTGHLEMPSDLLLFCFLEPWAHLSDKNLENKRRNSFLI